MRATHLATHSHRRTGHRCAASWWRPTFPAANTLQGSKQLIGVVGLRRLLLRYWRVMSPSHSTCGPPWVEGGCTGHWRRTTTMRAHHFSTLLLDGLLLFCQQLLPLHIQLQQERVRKE